MSDATLPSSHKVLSRKYRPKCFREIAGQDLFVQLISKALMHQKVGHSFLFTGERGVGKTTSARVLAMALNCFSPQKGEFFEPCGTCVSCQNFLTDKHLDIIEIDAASHTGVDDVRQLIESSQYQPMMGAYKVFIIDEVHMLSKSAFNALLKTLEEPPAHVKFIFATTEVKKIPLTILSRCLRFDLRRIPLEVIEHHLEMVCKAEKVTAEKEALHLIANVSEGSLRDALSVLEQVFLLTVGLQEKVVERSLVENILGVVNPVLFQSFFKALAQQKTKEALLATEEFYKEGGDALMLLEKLGDYVYALLYLSIDKQAPLKHFLKSEKRFLQEIYGSFSLSQLGSLWQAILKGREEILSATLPERALDVLIIRLIHGLELPASQSLKSPAGKLPPPPPSAQTTEQVPPSLFNTFDDVLIALGDKRHALLRAQLLAEADVQDFKPGHVSLLLKKNAPQRIAQDLEAFLREETKKPWVVSVGDVPPTATFLEKEQALEEALKNEVLRQPALQKLKSFFPEAEIRSIDTKRR
jgi:DNA polymerase-3 subunit gamma/tau